MRLVKAKDGVLEISEQKNREFLKAAQVSSGMLGVVKEVTLEVMPAYDLEERQTASSFTRQEANAASYSADLVAMVKSFGLDLARGGTSMEELETALRDARYHSGPALIEVPITKDAALASAEGTGWWDFPPAPTASWEIWQDYTAGRAAQQHLG